MTTPAAGYEPHSVRPMSAGALPAMAVLLALLTFMTALLCFRPCLADSTSETTWPGPAQIYGFRSAKFGMTQTEVRSAILRDFGVRAPKLRQISGKTGPTSVLTFEASDLVPDTGEARLLYAFGARGKTLSVVQIVWGGIQGHNPGRAALLALGRALQAYFLRNGLESPGTILDQSLGPDLNIVFRTTDSAQHMIMVLITPGSKKIIGPSASVMNSQGPPLLVVLSYLADPSYAASFAK